MEPSRHPFPQHLLEDILSRLPALCLLRLRIVCKLWHSFLSSPSFLRLHSIHSPSHPPWFLISTDDYHVNSTYDPLTHRLYHIPLPSFLATKKYRPVASAGGLLCFSSSADRPRVFFVCNPLTRVWRKLPPMISTPNFVRIVGMVADKDTNSYRVVVAGHRQFCCSKIITEVYESRQDKWKTAGDLLPRFSDPVPRPVFCNGFLYTMNFRANRLLIFSLKEESWELVPTAKLERSPSMSIFEWNGHLLVAGGYLENENEPSESICIWEHQAQESGWVMVDKMPDGLCKEFLGSRELFVCEGCNGLLLFLRRAYLPMVLYDICQKSWRRLPSCILPDHRTINKWSDIIAYEPTLYAAA